MKNINPLTPLLTLLLFSFSSFSQDSLAHQTKCDSLKAAYEAKLIDVKIIENEMKFDKPYHLPYDDDSYFRAKQGWDSLYVVYKKQWKEIKILTSKYLLCIGKDISSCEKTQNEIPPAPPPPCEPVDPRKDFWSYRTPSQPFLTDEEQNRFNNYINTNYPIMALKNSISGSVELSFLCDEEGIVNNILVLNENPDNFGFGELSTEAIKKIKFRPAFQNDLPIKMRIKKIIDFKPPKKESSECDRLKAVYETHQVKFDNIYNEMKYLNNSKTEKESQISKQKYDSLYIEYHKTWKLYQDAQVAYLKLIRVSSKSIFKNIG